MPIRMTGLTSGLDTESIVNQLMSAQRTKQTKVENKKQKLEWKQEIWKGLNTKIYGFYKDSLSKMKYSSNYSTKKASVSDSTKLTATASTKAAAGSYKVEINKIASAQYVTSGKLDYKDTDGKTAKTATSSTKLGDLGMSLGTVLKLEVGDKSSALEVKDDTTIKDFVDFCSNAGLNATFDEKQQRFFLSSKDSGEENSFKLSANGYSSDGQTIVNNLNDAVGLTNLTSDQKKTYNSIVYGAIASNKEISSDDITTLQTLAKSSADAEANSKATAFYRAKLEKNYTLSDEDAKAIEDKYNANDTLTNEDKATAIQKEKDEKKKADIDKQMATDESKAAITKLVESGITAQNVSDAGLDDASQYTFESKTERDNVAKEAVNNAVTAYNKVASKGITSTNSALAALGLQNVDGSAVSESSNSLGMVVTEASDTEIVYNGATLKSNNTSIEVAGVTLNLLGTTATGESVNITVSNDTSAVYDTIKEFITEYNSILKTMNTYYDAASASSYEVLTDDQKKAMSDDEVDKWNTKIKDSLLRRDSTLNSLISTLKTDMMGTVTASNGKTYSLANLGITTSSKNYSEGGLLHIKGDEDDDEFADSTNTLMQMLEEDPDTVKEVLSGLASNLYDSLNKKMGTTTLSSALTFYNDKEMASQLSDYKKEISDWESKLSDMEEKYYSQFSAMESALAKIQSQQNTLSSYLGS
ncbi:MAG: flagellar filament capping protein FliD [Lachnospiraceae bacterium]|nr:MAG: flagellar filament capping protein FliD [Lachnospiraceae bacterium]